MTLRSGDLDTSLQELLTEAMEELERQMASKDAAAGEEQQRPNQVPEAKKVKGPDLMRLWQRRGGASCEAPGGAVQLSRPGLGVDLGLGPEAQG